MSVSPKSLEEHIRDDDIFHNDMHRVLYGDPDDDNDIGLIQMVRELHVLLVKAKGVKGFFSLLILIGALFGAFAAIKTFFITFILK